MKILKCLCLFPWVPLSIGAQGLAFMTQAQSGLFTCKGIWEDWGKGSQKFRLLKRQQLLWYPVVAGVEVSVDTSIQEPHVD